MDDKRKKMADVGALLLAVEGEESNPSSYEDEADPMQVAEDAAGELMEALAKKDKGAVAKAFRMLMDVCPMMDDEKEGEEEPERDYEEVN